MKPKQSISRAEQMIQHTDVSTDVHLSRHVRSGRVACSCGGGGSVVYGEARANKRDDRCTASTMHNPELGQVK